MAVAITLNQFFTKQHIDYELIKHRPTETALDSSKSARLPPEQVAKAVILEDTDGNLLMASVPARRRVSINRLNTLTDNQYKLVSEIRLIELFPDCKKGAIPGVGNAYNLKMMVDDELLSSPYVYIEAGDHQHMVKINGNEYRQLVANMPHGEIHGGQLGFRHFRERKPSWKWIP
ncbi:deacylase [Thalassotalea sp. 42_200_T64]|nr:deacylase [Thalassotalea sp. 42_200_T64]